MITAWVLVLALGAGCTASDDDQVSPDGAPNSTVEGSSPNPTVTLAPPGGSGDGTAPLPPVVDPNGPVGGYARLLLDPAAPLKVAVLTQSGGEPDPATLDGLRTTLEEVTGKSVTILESEAVAGGPDWTGEEIRRVGSAAGPASSGGEAVVKLLFLRGEFADRPTALGVAVSATVAAVFTEQVREAVGLLGSTRRHELAVTIHELGHLLGLVDLVLDTGREDPEHPGHSRNRDSVMFWAVESSLIRDVLAGGPSTEFDRADRADLERIRTSS